MGEEKISSKELIGGPASDLIGLNPLDNEEIFIASTLHLMKFKSPESTAQEMFMKV